MPVNAFALSLWQPEVTWVLYVWRRDTDTPHPCIHIGKENAGRKKIMITNIERSY